MNTLQKAIDQAKAFEAAIEEAEATQSPVVSVTCEGWENMIDIPIAEYTRLKDIETRFSIIREQMLKAEYCPIHTQIILGIEKEYEQKQAQRKGIEVPAFMQK